jgi:hypothetical protein
MEPIHPATPKRRLGRMPSMALSDTSPSNRQIQAPAVEGIILPPWSGSVPEKWLLQLRQAIKGVVYRFTIQVHEAMKIFEESNKTFYLNYQGLEQGLRKLWSSWRAFSRCKDIDEEVLESSPIYFDFDNLIKKMKTPIGIRRTPEMDRIRMAARSVVKDVVELRRVVEVSFEEIDIRTEESETTGVKADCAQAFLPIPASDTPTLQESVQKRIGTVS